MSRSEKRSPERPQSRGTIARSEARYRTLFESIDQGFCVLEVLFDDAGDPVDYRYVETNHVFEEQSGLRDAVGRTVRELVPEIEPFWIEAYGRVARTGEPTRRVDHSKSLGRWFDVYAFRVGEPDEHTVAVLFSDITEQKRAEEALAAITVDSERQRRLYETIISNTPDLVYVFGLDYRFTFVNDALLEMWGRSLEDSIGKTLLEVGYEPWHAEMHEREIDQVVATKQPVRGEVDFPHATLGRRTYDYILVPVLDASGEVESVAGTTRDVTDRRRSEAEREHLLREVEAEQRQLSELFQHAPSFMAMLRGPEHVFVRANQRYLRLIGQRDILGKPVREAIPEAASQGFVELLDQVYETGAPYRGFDTRLELESPAGSGSGGLQERWVDFVYQPLRGANGEIEGILVQGVDVTERKRAERAVRESEERLRNLADNIAQLAWMANGRGAIYWCNRRWLDYTGTSLEQIRRRGWAAVAHPEHVDAVVEKFRTCVREGCDWEDTFPLRSKDGESRWFLSRAVPIRDDEGTVVRWFGTHTDVTERIRLEDALKEADRRKDEFLATLAHELRNPLGPIRMAAELLDVAEPDSERTREVAHVLVRQTRHMTRLIDDLLDLSRITRGKIELRTERLDLAALIARSEESFQAESEAAGLRFATHFPAQPVMIEGDPERVVQIVNNLVNNARQFTDAGGAVSLSVGQEGEWAVIRVRDTGVGIAPEDLERIFDMFAQVGSPGRTTAGGLGIGLSLTRTLVGLHEGAVVAESEGRGRGSEFIVRLPLAPALAPADEEARATTVNPGRDGGAGPSRRVLAVDDNGDALMAVAALLTARGHDVETAAGGAEALEKARAHRPEVVLLDIGMPDLDGYEVARRLRREPWGREVLLVALTGWGQAKDKDDAAAAGFDVHLTKPAEADEIARLLRDPPRWRATARGAQRDGARDGA